MNRGRADATSTDVAYAVAIAAVAVAGRLWILASTPPSAPVSDMAEDLGPRPAHLAAGRALSRQLANARTAAGARRRLHARRRSFRRCGSPAQRRRRRSHGRAHVSAGSAFHHAGASSRRRARRRALPVAARLHQPGRDREPGHVAAGRDDPRRDLCVAAGARRLGSARRGDHAGATGRNRDAGGAGWDGGAASDPLRETAPRRDVRCAWRWSWPASRSR